MSIIKKILGYTNSYYEVFSYLDSDEKRKWGMIERRYRIIPLKGKIVERGKDREWAEEKIKELDLEYVNPCMAMAIDPGLRGIGPQWGKKR